MYYYTVDIMEYHLIIEFLSHGKHRMKIYFVVL